MDELFKVRIDLLCSYCFGSGVFKKCRFANSVRSGRDSNLAALEKVDTVISTLTELNKLYKTISAHISDDRLDNLKWAMVYDTAHWIKQWMATNICLADFLKQDIVTEFDMQYCLFKSSNDPEVVEDMFKSALRVLTGLNQSLLESTKQYYDEVIRLDNKKEYPPTLEGGPFERCQIFVKTISKFLCPTKFKPDMWFDNIDHSKGKLKQHVKNNLPNSAAVAFKHLYKCADEVYSTMYMEASQTHADDLGFVIPGGECVDKILAKYAKRASRSELMKAREIFGKIVKQWFILGWVFLTGIDSGRIIVYELVFVLKSTIREVTSINRKKEFDEDSKNAIRQYFPILSFGLDLVERETDALIYMVVSRLVEGEQTPIIIILMLCMVVGFDESSLERLSLDKFAEEMSRLMKLLQKRGKENSGLTKMHKMLKSLIGADSDIRKTQRSVLETTEVLYNELDELRSSANSETSCTKSLYTDDTMFFNGGETTQRFFKPYHVDNSEVFESAGFTTLGRRRRLDSESSSGTDTDSEEIEEGDDSKMGEVVWSHIKIELSNARIAAATVNMILNQKRHLNY